MLVAVVAIVWYGFKFLGRLKDQRDKEAKIRRNTESQDPSGRSSPRTESPEAVDAEEMVKCPGCGAYFSPLSAGSGTRCGNCAGGSIKRG
ncbi:MAG: hypothetical protein AAF530_18540 [Pseudomonadota bacterium]